LSDHSYRPSGPSQEAWRGWVWQVLAGLAALGLPLIFVLAGIAAETLSLAAQIPVAVLLTVAAGSVILLVRALWRQGARHRAPSGADAVQSDERAPVLYLRSFGEETSVFAEEEALARIMIEIGPFVAIGRPGDALPPLGASRFYGRHFERGGRGWQEFIHELVSRATLVFLMPGPTVGLAWEVMQCRKLLHPHSLMLLVQGRRDTYDTFRRETAADVGMSIPEFPAEHSKGRGDDEFIGIVRFRPDWTAYFWPFPERPGRIAHVDHVDIREDRLRAGLLPALAEQGLVLKSRGRQTRTAIWSMWAVYLVVAIGLVVTWLWFR